MNFKTSSTDPLRGQISEMWNLKHSSVKQIPDNLKKIYRKIIWQTIYLGSTQVKDDGRKVIYTS